MGFFKTAEEKEVIKQNKVEKKEAAKDHRKALKAAGRTGMIMIEHIGGHPKLRANTTVLVTQGLEKYTLNIDNNLVTVKGLEWDEKGTRSVGKAAAGAIVGSVLLPGIGTIAGAAMGAKKKNTSTAILTCTDADGIVEYTVYFRADSAKYQKLASLL